MFEEERKEFESIIDDFKQFILFEIKSIVRLDRNDFIEFSKKHWNPKNAGVINIIKDGYSLEIIKTKTEFVVKLLYNEKCIPCVFSKDHISLNSFFKDVTYAYYFGEFRKSEDLLREFLKKFKNH